MKSGKTLHRTIAGLLASATCLSALPAIAAQAATEQRLVGYRGDLDGDNAVTVTDAVLLAQHLVGAVPITDADTALRADLDQNGKLNGVDLTLLKRVLLTGAEPEGIYEEIEIDDPPADEEMIDAPIKALSPTVLSKGHNKLLMLVVDFPDCKFKQNYTAEQIKEISFGAANPSSQYYPLESVIGYYERSSYGALTMDADVYTYSAKQSISVYTNNTDTLVEEVMAALDDQINFADYDVNNDGIMDTILLSVADNAPDDGWWPCSGGYYGDKRFDGVKGGNVILGNTSPQDTEVYNNTWIHELGHAMGLPDYYKYENTEDGYYGLNGPAGTEMMDDAYGDMCAFSKLMYGWYTPSQIQVYEGGTQTFTLQSSQVAGNCVIIPRGDLNGYLSEYMILEYATHEGNNATWWIFDNQNSGGLRALHCEGSVSNGWWGPEFTWNNYGKNYDTTNKTRRVLRLVNESEGGKFFTAGQRVDSSISGFRWYDNSGYQTVDTGVTVTVDSIENGVMTITVSQN